MHNIKFRAKNIVFVFFKVLGNEKLPILQLCNTDICLATSALAKLDVLQLISASQKTT